jgi:four helix bundle protein
MEANLRQYDLEDRLVKFTLCIFELTEKLPNSRVGIHLANQIVRSGSAPALLYGEALAAESRSDFIHKMKIALKELRETRVNLRLILEKPILADDKTKDTFRECNELVAIFAKSIETAKANNQRR